MIRLKSLLTEQEASTDGKSSPIAELPNVLFLGDAYTKSKSGYAYRLIRSKTVKGKVIAWPDVNIKQLTKMLKRYLNEKYSIVSIMFGDAVKNETDIAKFETQAQELVRLAGSFGAEVVIVQNPFNEYKDQEELLSIIEELPVDLQIENSLSLASGNTAYKIATVWAKVVNSKLNVELPDTKDKLDADTGTETGTKPAENDIAPSETIDADFSASIVDQAYDLIIPFEGFTPVAKKDTDGYCRIGHGSSHITKQDGTVIDLGQPSGGKSCQETYPYTITIDDAHRDLRRLIPHTFLPLVKRKIKEWGGDISKFNDATIATLISVAYNYGHIPSELKAGIAASDAAAIGNALANDFNNPKSNPKRRKKEGNYILSSLKGGGAGGGEQEPSLWSKVKSHLFNRKASGGSTIEFSAHAQKDLNDSLLNPNLIDDIKKAAEAAGVTVKISTAKTGHKTNTSSGHRSRHADGLAVDISEINGLNWNSKQHAIQLGAYEPAEAFADELVKLGYTKNNEYGNDKAILTFGFKDHDNHIHVSRKS